MSAATHGHVQGFFSCSSLGERKIKGISRPIELFRAVTKSAIHSRFELAVSRGLGPLVGRQKELSMLLRSFSSAERGRGCAILIRGEAGIGKSRLVHGLKERVETKCSWRSCFGSPQDTNRALYPLLNLARRALGVEKSDSTQGIVERIRRRLSRADHHEDEAAPLLAALLSHPVPGVQAPREIPAQVQREKTLALLRSLLIPQKDEPALILLVEDLQWVDPSTLDFLEQLIDGAATQRILLLMTARPVFMTRWRQRSGLSQLQLSRVEDRHVEELVKALTGGRSLPERVLRHLVRKTDGIPLFVEEITRSILESGLVTPCGGRYVLAEPLRELEIPSTLQGSLAARLDRLGGAKEVAQLAAAIGRRFSFRLLAEVSPLGPKPLQRELQRLIGAQLIRRKAIYSGDETYTFNHALIRDAAYDSLLVTEKRRLHRRIALALEKRLPDGGLSWGKPATQVPVELQQDERDEPVLAHHWSQVIDRKRPEPDLVRKAAEYLTKAGEHQLHLSGYEEAITLLRQALEMVCLLPDQPARDLQELDLQIALSTAIRPLEGWDSPELTGIYRRARDLCGKIGTASQLAPVLYGLWADRLAHLDLERAYTIGCELQELGKQVNEPDIAVQALLTTGQVHFWRGELGQCRHVMDRALCELREPGVAALYKQHFGHEPLTVALMFENQCAWLLGEVAFANAALAELFEHLESLEHPFSRAMALQAAAWAGYHAGDVDGARRSAERLIALCKEHDFPFYRGAGHMFRGWAVARSGEPASGIAEISDGFENCIAAFGGKVTHSLYCLLRCEACHIADDRDGGLQMVEKGLEVAHEHNELIYVAELQRFRGVLLGERSAGGEQALRSAVATARRQGALLFELRAKLGLARLLRKCDEGAGVERPLAELVARFPASARCADLDEARAFLSG